MNPSFSEKPPFIVYALPRSRTAWMAEFLTYGGWGCWHEQSIYMRRIEDLKALLSNPGIGTVETAAAQGWRLLHHYNPDVNAVVVRRPIDDVVRSMMATDLKGEAHYEEASLRKIMEYGDRMLSDVSANCHNCLTLDFADLATKDGCAALFEHCVPFAFDNDWWTEMAAKNVQADVLAAIRYFHENRAEIQGFKKLLWRDLRRLRTSGEITKH